MTTAGGAAQLRVALSCGRGRLRPFVVLAVVVGVLAMHAVTVGHHPATRLTAALSAPAPVVAIHETADRTDGVTVGMTGMLLAASVAADRCAGCRHESPGPSRTGSHLLDVCMVVLLAGTVTLLLLLAGRAPGRGKSLPTSWRAVPLAAPARPPPLSLPQICVLRT